jgi:SAM-dependent methyltransferase
MQPLVRLCLVAPSGGRLQCQRTGPGRVTGGHKIGSHPGRPTARQNLETRVIGLDFALPFVRWLTGAEHLHCGVWTGLEVTAGNMRAAQEAYSARLFAHLPARSGLRILDIGGGSGETTAKLIALGHKVDIVVPSSLLAERCRENVPTARVHECMFENIGGSGPCDVCLFFECYQYVTLDIGLSRAIALLASGGEVLIGDCFRSAACRGGTGKPTVGGGHRLQAFRDLVTALP